MKKMLFFMALFAIVSCAKEEQTPNEKTERESVALLEQLIQRAEEGRMKFTATKSGNICVDRSKIYYIRDISTRADVADTLMCVLNFEENNGFAIFAVNHGLSDLVAVTESGFYDGTPTGIPGFDAYMEDIAAYVRNYDYSLVSGTTDEIEAKASSSQKVVKPIIPVSWHQFKPFNWFCSEPFNNDTVAGCVAIAIAQALTVAKYPEKINLTYPTATEVSMVLDWNSILSHTYSDSSCKRGNCEICCQMATLIREIGERVDMEYGPASNGGSGAYTLTKTKPCLESLGYTCDGYYDFLPSYITASLDKKYPVIVRGRKSDNSGGHAWNIDGYEYSQSTSYQYDISGMTTGTCVTETWYVYFKYGWRNGENNGKYLAYRQVTSSGSYTVTGKTSVTTPVTVFSDNSGNDYSVKIFTNIRKSE